jgi:hypothetical protein
MRVTNFISHPAVKALTSRRNLNKTNKKKEKGVKIKKTADAVSGKREGHHT